MVATPRVHPLVLNSCVNMDRLTGSPGPEWTLVNCFRSRKAYGCGKHGQEVVDGLELYTNLGEGQVLTSSMAIRMGDRALRCVDEELGLAAPHRRYRSQPEISGGGIIQYAGQNLIVLVLIFNCDYRRDLLYHLVVDAIDANLSLFKYLPDRHEADCGLKPVLERTFDGRDYELVLMARKMGIPEVETGIHEQDVLCVCSPETRDVGTCPWLTKERLFRSMVPDTFSADVAFSFQGKAFWGDLCQGIMYCDLHTSRSVVNFDFISLPEECQHNLETMPNDEQIKRTRTMGCAGDSIWFICIERSGSYAAPADVVTIWTLNLIDKEWTELKKVCSTDLWGLDSFRDAGLHKARLVYPVLTPDGALSFVLPQQRMFNGHSPVDDCICGFDLCLKNLLWHGRVHNYHSNDPVILPCDFFSMLRKRKRTRPRSAARLQ